MSWHRKHLLDIESLTVEEIITVLDTARASKRSGQRAIKKVPALRGKTVVNLFVEPSTRTRTSFELAEQRLSADVVNFNTEASSFKKGETLKDTARNLEALNIDFIIIRHSASGAPISSPASSTPASSMPATARTSIPPRRCWICSPSGRRKAASRA
jgi:aspartate carbamoyltransferase catalytic subunit